jgi:hypothetical protein
LLEGDILGKCDASSAPGNSTGIEESSNYSLFNIYPNPSSGNTLLQTTMKANEALKIIVTDIQGKVVISEMNFTTGKPIELPTASLKNGVYNIQIVSENNSSTLKLVMMH